MKCKFIYCLCFILISTILKSQENGEWSGKPSFEFTGFIESFYAYDFNKPEGNSRQNFFFNHNRHNEFNINMALLQFNIRHNKYRANVAFHAGTYANDNYVNEPGVLKNIFEANAGFSLNKKNTLWVDAGIFSSHLGFESAISIDNYTLTRSFAAENSPYFLTGAKLTFTPNEKWEVMAMINNGWQRIQRVQGNSLPSFGTQVQYKPNKTFLVNWSTFIGTDDPDDFRRMMYFNNFYGVFKINENLEFIGGVDIGIRQQFKGSSNYHLWMTPVAITRVKFSKKWSSSLRFEYFLDENEVIIPTITANGFKTIGTSLNIDYSPVNLFAFRIEGRWLNSRDTIFETSNQLSNNNFFITTSIAVKFQQKWNE